MLHHWFGKDFIGASNEGSMSIKAECEHNWEYMNSEQQHDRITLVVCNYNHYYCKKCLERKRVLDSTDYPRKDSWGYKRYYQNVKG